MAKNLLILCFLVMTGCIPVEDVDGEVNLDVAIPELPCIDGWQFNFLGEPLVNPDTGEQLTCGMPIATTSN